MDVPAHLNVITGRIIGAAIEVHRHLGPGLLESSYMRCLQIELASQGVSYSPQHPVPLTYKGVRIAACYRIDLVVERSVLVELKCVDRVLPVHEAQLLTYLRLTGYQVGLLINFNVPRLTAGIIRRANTRPADACEESRTQRRDAGTAETRRGLPTKA
jgi:GxxExxY protein